MLDLQINRVSFTSTNATPLNRNSVGALHRIVLSSDLLGRRSALLRLSPCSLWRFSSGVPLFDRRFLPAADHEFVVIADTHYMLAVGDAPVEFESRRKQTARAGAALGLVADLEVEHVIHLGDLVQEYPETPGFDQALGEALEQIHDLGLSPHYVAGNHDVGDKPDPTMPTHDVSPEGLAKFNTQVGPSWKCVDIGPHRILIINSQILNTDLPDATDQRGWLEEQLAESVEGRTYLFLHLPLYLFDGTEQAFGHYDVIDEPDRSWLLGLIRRKDIDTVCAAHVHTAFTDRIGEADYHILPSACFTRPGFSHLFSSAPPSEHGRDDTPKLGFCLFRLTRDRTDVHPIRTHAAEKVDLRTRLLTRTSDALSASPVGVTFRDAISPIGSVPIAYPSVIVQPVRNDYPLLSALEMGVRHIRVPAAVLDEHQLRRVRILRNRGVVVTAYHLFAHPSAAAEMAIRLRDIVDGLEIQFAATHTDDFTQITPNGLQLTLCPVSPGVTVPGKQHPRTRIGYSLEEAAAIDSSDVRYLCRIAPGDSLVHWLEAQPVTSGHADFAVDLPGVHDIVNAHRVAESLLATATVAGSRVFIDPLTDFDRTMDLSNGLIDTRCNPRPAMTVVRMLSTILFSHGEAWSLAASDPWTLTSSTRRLIFSQDTQPGTKTTYGLTTGTVTDFAQDLDDTLLLSEYLM